MQRREGKGACGKGISSPSCGGGGREGFQGFDALFFYGKGRRRGGGKARARI